MEPPAKRRWFTPFNRRVFAVISLVVFAIGIIMERAIGPTVVDMIGMTAVIFSINWFGFDGIKYQTGQAPLPPKALMIFDIMLLLGGVILFCLW